MGWSVGFAIHYLPVYGIPGKGPLDEKWQAKEIEKELPNLPHIFISSIAGKGINQLKDLSQANIINNNASKIMYSFSIR